MPLPNPFEIRRRPFAVDPVTGAMLPDGLFDCTIGRLDIMVAIHNNSDDKFDQLHFGLEMYTPNDFLIIGNRNGVIRDFMPNSTVLVSFKADFSASVAGKKELMIWISGGGFKYENKNHLKNIFVTRTTFDSNNRIYICETDAGIFQQSFVEIARSPKGEIYNSEYTGNRPQIFVPLHVKTSLFPKQPFSGVYECLPYRDPLWKVIAWLIAAVAALGAYIAARNGKGTMSIGIVADETPDGDYKICNPHHQDLEETTTLAGTLSLVANAAIVVGLKHYRDPWIIGRESIVLEQNENIIEENVDFKLVPDFPIIVGAANKVKAEWWYSAKTDKGKELSFQQTQNGENPDLAPNFEILAPQTVTGLSIIQLGMKVYKDEAATSFYRADEIYAFCLLVSPPPLKKEYRILLQDNGAKYDQTQNDGWFNGGVHLEELLPELTREQMTGDWTAYFFAQLTNGAPQEATVEESTGYIGGSFLVHPMSVSSNSDNLCTWQKALRLINVSFP